MIDCHGTRFELLDQGNGLWIFKKWQDFLLKAGLGDFTDFCTLTGKEMDRNRRSVVYRLELGAAKEVFYLKLHKNYYKKNLATLFRKVPYLQIELANMMEYARAGLKDLEPVAWGWQQGTTEGDISFLLIKELSNYKSLQEWLNDPACATPKQRRPLARAVARMMATMHDHGLAHIDLFTWHIFAKKEGEHWTAHPIDLERTKRQGCWPWSKQLNRHKQANDLAVLHLTTPWPQTSWRERMRCYHDYCEFRKFPKGDRFFLAQVLSIARHRGRKGKFQVYGVAEQLRGK
ncbi:MAG: lipopolysaccharide kinase InaA family protein [Proteobacteria bacterium]|nr:lipopolysaccharide kinase InaA family protein [Pseudomonadota bacterium]MBU1641561.1 lipopolysaccharide kinase InaA family protein [Pseudomonadota bacterium]